jgi:hypothetical protein
MTDQNAHIGGKEGRPTDYKPEYCQMLIEHMEEGYSFESFGGIIGVAEKTLYNWEKQHPDFLHSKEIGVQKSMIWWERVGRKGMMNDIPFFNDRIWRLNMINRFRSKWSDGTKNENNDKVKKEIVVRYANNRDNTTDTSQDTD